ncbi:MAG: FAD-dependent monooxygenase [Pseudomonadota bacterium]
MTPETRRTLLSRGARKVFEKDAVVFEQGLAGGSMLVIETGRVEITSIMESGRTVLLGDAAHPMLPFMAQGAGMALEDVPVLVNAVGSGSDIPAALEAFERRRWPRVTRVLQRARANGRLFHHPPGMAQWLARTPIRLAGQIAPGLAAGQLDWLYGFDATQG